MTRKTRRVARCGVHLFIIGVFGTQFALAQVPAAPRTGSNAPAPAVLRAGTAPVLEAGASTEPSSVQLLVGRSTLVDIGSPIARVSLTSSDVADALVTSPTQLLVHGKVPGSISMFVWDRSGGVKRYEIAVQRDLDRLSEQVRQLFPGERIEVHSNGKSVVLSGQVSSKDVADKAVSVAAGYVDNKAEVVTLLQVQPGPRSNQVLLRVRFAEVSRSAMSEYGMSFFTSPTGVKNNVGRITTQQFPGGPAYTDLAWTKANSDFGSPVTSAEGKIAFSDFLNVFLLNQKYDLGVLIKALQNRGLFQSLAEPNLVAESGKEASFLAGGEFPIPVAQGSAANMAVSVQFKEFGIRLNFTPTVNGDRVHLKVRPEVSTLDYGNAVVMNGFRIPALQTRRTETELELKNGQTFAIAGLMNNQMQQTMQKVPGIGDIPIIGYLFRSKASQRDQTELVVMITPEILPNDSPGVTPSLPRYPDTFLPPVSENGSHPAPAPAFSGSSRSQASTPGAVTPAPVAAAPATDARTDIERAQDRAQQALEQPRQAEGPVVPPPPTSPSQTNVAPPAAAKEAATDAREQTAEQRQLEKQAREPAKKDAKAAELARKEEARQAAAAQKEQEKAAREQAKRDAEAAKLKAKQDAEEAKREAEAAKLQAKKDAEAAKAPQKAVQAQASQTDDAATRQALEAKTEAERQEAIEAAAERLRAAEAEYQAELARRAEQR